MEWDSLELRGNKLAGHTPNELRCRKVFALLPLKCTDLKVRWLVPLIRVKRWDPSYINFTYRWTDSCQKGGWVKSEMLTIAQYGRLRLEGKL